MSLEIARLLAERFLKWRMEFRAIFRTMFRLSWTASSSTLQKSSPKWTSSNQCMLSTDHSMRAKRNSSSAARGRLEM